MKFSLLFASLGLACAGAWAQDGGGTIHASTTIHPDGTRSTMVTDPEKSTAEETVTNSAGKVLSKITYLMDEHGEAIGSMTYNAKGVVQYRTSYKRDALNRVDEEDISAAAGTLLRRRVYTYGNGNKVLNIQEFDGDGRLVSDAKTKPMTVRKAIPIRR